MLSFLSDPLLTKPLFPLEGKVEELHLPENELERLALLPFEGKVPNPGNEKKAIVLWGPPNSGKTSESDKLLASLSDDEKKYLVSVCYDEPVGHPKSGAIFNIEAFSSRHSELVKQLKSAGGEGKRKSIYEGFLSIFQEERSNSQRIRSLTLNEAVYRGHDVFIDTTSSSGGVLFMLDTLAKRGYKIEYWGFLAPLQVAEQRASLRTRPVEVEELYGKRIGALETLDKIVHAADCVKLFWNPTNGQRAEMFLETRDFGNKAGCNVGIYRNVVEALSGEPAYLETHGNPIAQKYAVGLGRAVCCFAEKIESLSIPFPLRGKDSTLRGNSPGCLRK